MAAPYVPSLGGTSTLIPYGPGPGFGAGLLGDLEGMVTGFVPSLKTVLSAGYHDIGANIHGHPTGLLLHGKSGVGGQFGKKVIIPSLVQQRDWARDPIGNIKHGHILLPFLDALTILSAGGGRIAAVGMTPKELGAAARVRAAVSGKYEGPIKQITAELPSGETQVLKTLPRSAYRAKKALAVERAKRGTFGTSGIKIGDRTIGGRFGTDARAAKVEKTAQNKIVLSAFSDPRVVGWQKAYQQLSVPERITFHIKARLPIPKDLETWKTVLAGSDQPSAKQTLDLINKPAVKDLYAGVKESPKLANALDAWRGISQARQEILLRHGAIDPWQIQEGELRHTMFMRGAEVLTRSKAYKMFRSIDSEINSLNRRIPQTVNKAKTVGTKEIRQQVAEGRKASTEAMATSVQKERFHRLSQNTDQKLAKARALREDWRTAFQAGVETSQQARHLGALQARMAKAYDDYEHSMVAEHVYARLTEKSYRLAERQRAGSAGALGAREKRIQALQGMRAQLHELIDARHEQEAQMAQLEMLRGRIPKSNIGPLVGGTPIDELLAEFEKAGIDPHGYVPDVPARGKPDYITTGEGSIGPPRPGADVYPTTGVQFRHGMIDLIGDHITASFLRAAKHQRQANLHDWAMRVGKKVPKGGLLPEGYEWVKAYRGQRIPYTQTHQAEHIRSTNPFDALNPDEFDQITAGHELTWEESAKVAGGQYRVAVPKAIADQFRADFASSKGFGSKFLRKATNVWRALLLRVRIGWLENNIIGNTIMASIRFAGINGLKAYLNLIGQMAGPKKVLQLLNMDVSKHVLTEEQWARLFPEALRGTHIETQLPRSQMRFGGESRTSKVLGVGERALLGKKYGVANLLPNADRWYESFLRKGGVMTTLRKQPEVRDAYNAQKGDKSWADAIESAVGQHPHLQELAVQEIHDALGNFLSLSKVEREQVRQLIPFYAWFREITRVTGKLVVDTPGRALIVAQLGLIGNEDTPQGVPSYLKGGIPVSGLPSWLGGTSQYGQQSIISTRAMTPFSTPLDLINAGVSTLRGSGGNESTRLIAGEINPYLAALLNLQRRASIPHVPLSGSLLGQVLSQPITNLPEYRAATGPPSTLYPTRGALDRWLQAMGGSPIRTYDKNEAQAREGQ